MRLEVAATPVEQQIAQLIDQQPEEVAQTLRSWLADRRS
jgi:flagellar biosynthesis/type III secretory pathway M-ring protein FliF/YscJ